MGKINFTRVILGGLLAGLVVNIFEYVTNGVVLASQWGDGMKALGHEMPQGAIPIFIVTSFVMGIGVVWLYAAARPRLGPGAKTAVLTGVAFWFFAYALPNSSYAVMQLFSTRLITITTLVALVELIAASLCGAWLYRE